MHDKRSIKVKLSDKGLKICKKMDDLFDEHIKILEGTRSSGKI